MKRQSSEGERELWGITMIVENRSEESLQAVKFRIHDIVLVRRTIGGGREWYDIRHVWKMIVDCKYMKRFSHSPINDMHAHFISQWKRIKGSNIFNWERLCTLADIFSYKIFVINFSLLPTNPSFSCIFNFIDP